MVNILRISLLMAMTATLIGAVVPAAAQQQDEVLRDLIFLRDSPALADVDSAARHKEPLLPDDEVSDLRIISHFMIRTYQIGVSSQQHNVCVFTPSCSHFGMESVRGAGFIKGVLATADRLTRCNAAVSKGGYAFDRHARKFADPAPAYCGDTTGTVSCTLSCGRPAP